MVLEPVSVILKFAFLAILYLFLFWVARSAIKDLRRLPGGGGRPTPEATGVHLASPALAARARTGAEPSLVVERARGVARGSAYDLSSGVVLGRGDTADIYVDDDFASARHARINPQGSTMVIEDLGSTNGTFLNGEALYGPRALHPGDRIQIGDTEFSFQR